MNTKEFIENLFQTNINLNDSEVLIMLNYYDVYWYDHPETLKQDIIQSENITDIFLLDFCNLPELAEYLNYTQINKNMFIDNNSLHEFIKLVETEFNNNIHLCIRYWYKEYYNLI
jgi:hypothetical protein